MLRTLFYEMRFTHTIEGEKKLLLSPMMFCSVLIIPCRDIIHYVALAYCGIFLSQLL